MKNLFLSFLAFLSFGSFGSHYLGGNISWTKNSSGQFIFELRVYKDCGVGTATYVSSTMYGPQGAISMTLDTIIDYTPECTGNKITCGVWGSGQGAIQMYVFKSTPQTLTGTPPSSGWVFYWTDSARPSSSLVNTNSSGLYFESRMFDSNTYGSPVFIEKYPEPLTSFNKTLSAAACKGNADDSLYYAFTSPLQSATSGISFASGYSISSPFPSSFTNSSNGSVIIDGNTGLITYDINTGTSGSYVYAVAVEQWRNGVLISRVTMDKVAAYYINLPANSPPSVAIDTAVYTDILQTGPYAYKVIKNVGDTLSFEISAFDVDMNTSSATSQIISFEANGTALPLPWGNGAALYDTLPVLTPVAPQTGFSSMVNNQVEFSWVIANEHYNKRSKGHLFNFNFKDDECPSPGSTTISLEVTVENPADTLQNTGLEDSRVGVVHIYPNPANDMITISGLTNEKVELLDIQGKLLRSYKMEGKSMVLKREELHSGVYLLSISNGQKMEVRKVIFK